MGVNSVDSRTRLDSRTVGAHIWEIVLIFVQGIIILSLESLRLPV